MSSAVGVAFSASRVKYMYICRHPGAATVGSDHAWMIVTGWGSSNQQVAGHSPAGFYCPLQAPKELGKPLTRMYGNTPTFTHVEHCHCRFRRRRLTFHNIISCSSSHSFRNLLYEVHFLSLVKHAYQGCWKAVRVDSMWNFSSPVIARKPWYPT